MRQIAEDVLKERYYQPGETCWGDVAERVAGFIANGNLTKFDTYDRSIRDLELIPNSPALMNAGTINPQMSACFSVPVGDSKEEIFDAVKYAAIIHSSGGGTGFNFSSIRAKGSPVGGTGKVASGPISFMKVFNAATETIKQGGKRRGANLGSLDVHHPDIKEFITCKSKEGELSNFNISVVVDDEFMNNPDPEIWNLIIEGNWSNGEPGILFKEARERDNKRPDLGELSETNPCGETALLPWESCNLASINLMSCFDGGSFNWNKFRSLVRLGVRFLNDMIDKNKYPLPQIEEATKKTRKIGLGVMGFADLLIALGMRYGDQDSLDFADKLFKDMREVAEDESKTIGGNNAALLSIAPTGSISLFAGVSSGIEPNFGYVYNRSTWASGEKTTYREVHPMFEEWICNKFSDMDCDALINHMEQFGTLNNGAEAYGDAFETRRLFVTAKDIPPMDHIRMQAVIQKHVDQAISKTCNVPKETTKEEISDLIKFAWESGCKGLTIYREGSRSDVVLETNATKKAEEKKEPIALHKIAEAKRIRMKSACGVLWVNVVFAGDNPAEVFITTEGGGCTANVSYIGRLISTSWQEGVDWEVACKQGDKVFCSACVKNKNGYAEGFSCAALISEAIRTAVALKKSELSQLERMSRFKHETTEYPIEMDNGYLCPECGAQLIHTDGCVSCTCGFSRCK